jgi:hypothetical protein
MLQLVHSCNIILSPEVAVMRIIGAGDDALGVEGDTEFGGDYGIPRMML